MATLEALHLGSRISDQHALRLVYLRRRSSFGPCSRQTEAPIMVSTTSRRAAAFATCRCASLIFCLYNHHRWWACLFPAPVPCLTWTPVASWPTLSPLLELAPALSSCCSRSGCRTLLQPHTRATPTIHSYNLREGPLEGRRGFGQQNLPRKLSAPSQLIGGCREP
jgi:hypothetical protein